MRVAIPIFQLIPIPPSPLPSIHLSSISASAIVHPYHFPLSKVWHIQLQWTCSATKNGTESICCTLSQRPSHSTKISSAYIHLPCHLQIQHCVLKEVFIHVSGDYTLFFLDPPSGHLVWTYRFASQNSQFKSPVHEIYFLPMPHIPCCILFKN